MEHSDIKATLERLLREGQRVITDLGNFTQQAESGDPEALLQHLRQMSQRFFTGLRQQLQDQSLPWLMLLRSWAQMSDGASPAEILMTPMIWWQPQQQTAEADSSSSSRQARVEAAAEELAAARDAYLELLQESADQSVERFAERLRSLEQEQLDARQLYQHWLETAEAAYEEMMMSEPFALATGRLTNAWSELLLLLQDNLDGVLGTAGLPTRRELSDTQAQIHEMRQQQRHQERQLRAEIAALQASVTALTAAASNENDQPE